MGKSTGMKGMVGRWAFFTMMVLPLAACFRPDAPPSPEFEPAESLVSENKSACPDLSGTYRLVHGSEESRLFTPYQLPAHEMDMLQLTRSTSGRFDYRLKMDQARFADQITALRVSNQAAYARWREMITQWEQQKREKNDTSVMEGKILQLGPLPERGGLLAASQCENFWTTVEYRDARPAALQTVDPDSNDIETHVLLTRGRKAALVFRYDHVRTRQFLPDLKIRTGLLNSVYAKLEPVQPALFDWQVTEQIAPLALVRSSIPPVQEQLDSAHRQGAQAGPDNAGLDLETVVAEAKRYAISHLSSGARINRFELEPFSAQTDTVEAARTDQARWISMKGEAGSNREVSDLLRAMMGYRKMKNVELVSIQANSQARVEFDIRLQIEAGNESQSRDTQ